ncbi:unnamed protein product [Paramecium pentaurelia]|uniref:Uncharacterized protein n=1 Tax=Paramecium pentaurelia TaxID=43138 RepID=A0A8S1UWB5_9CILI|nr:unnamed protein product [Paramecium pentaurelia]
MQMIKDDMIINNSNLDFSMTENQKFESICQQLKNICTVSQQLLAPKLRQKRIRKKRVMKKLYKNQNSEKVSSDIQPKKTILNYFEVSRNELEEKIALISGLQQQIQQIKLMMSQI